MTPKYLNSPKDHIVVFATRLSQSSENEYVFKEPPFINYSAIPNNRVAHNKSVGYYIRLLGIIYKFTFI